MGFRKLSATYMANVTLSNYLYKGLEAPVVILTDIEEITTAQAISLFYTALTRALDNLIILVSENARKAMIETISSNIQERG